MKASRCFGFFLFVLSALPVVGASDYPISNRAESIHPGRQSLLLTTLQQGVNQGSRTLRVLDPSKVDPRQWLLLISPDGSRQETHCVKSVSARDEKRKEIKLSEDLRRNFAGGSQVLQGSVARERGIVANLVEGAGRGNSRVSLDSTAEVDALEQVVFQSVDGRVREAHCVKAIVGTEVELVGELRNDYPKNSSLIQGRLIDGQPERDDNPCCCPGKRAGRR